jgi:hypothetical protein
MKEFSARFTALMTFTIMVTMALLSTAACADWAIKGEGNFSCPDYVSAKQSNTAKLYSSISWVQGFISGVNYQRALEIDTDSLIGRDFPAASIVRWLENYCRDNPQDYLADAAEALVVEIKEEQQ